MKPNRPVVIAKQPCPNALRILERHAGQLNCQIIHPGDCIELLPKETVQEGNTMVQIVTAKPRGLSWMQPTGQTKCGDLRQPDDPRGWCAPGP